MLLVNTTYLFVPLRTIKFLVPFVAEFINPNK